MGGVAPLIRAPLSPQPGTRTARHCAMRTHAYAERDADNEAPMQLPRWRRLHGGIDTVQYRWRAPALVD